MSSLLFCIKIKNDTLLHVANCYNDIMKIVFCCLDPRILGEGLSIGKPIYRK